MYKILIILVLILTSAFSSAAPVNWPWKGVSINFPNGRPSDLQRFKTELNINMVRFHVRVNQHARSNKISGEEALNDSIGWLDIMLNKCSELGITSVINYSQFPLWDPSNKSGKKNDIKKQSFWTNQKNREEVLNTVNKITSHFKNRGSELSAYDIISEPTVIISKKAKVPKQWTSLLNNIIELIQESDPKRWIIVSPGPGGGPKGYLDFHLQKRKNIILGLHMYLPHAFTHQGIKNRPNGVEYPGKVKLRKWDRDLLYKTLQPLRKFQEKTSMPVFVGEFSAIRWAIGGEIYISDLVSIFNQYDWGWAYFNSTGWHGWNPDYNQNYPGNEKYNKWQNDYIGIKSARWETLKNIFEINKKRSTPWKKRLNHVLQ